MRLQLRPQIPGSSDPELLWGSVLAASTIIATGWLHMGLTTPLCPLHSMSGIPCPTCGATRAMAGLLHGNFKTAFLLNPLMTGLLITAELYVVYAAVVVIGRLPRVRIESITCGKEQMIQMLAIVLIAANWIYVICQKKT